MHRQDICVCSPVEFVSARHRPGLNPFQASSPHFFKSQVAEKFFVEVVAAD